MSTGAPLLLHARRPELEGDADRVLALPRHHARLGSGVRVDADVLVEGVHVLPALGLAEDLEPARHVQEAGPGGRWVRHHDLALVDRLGQVLPGRRLGQVLLRRLGRVEADRRDPGVHPDPRRRVVLVPEVGVELLEPLRRVRQEHPLGLQHEQARGGQAPDHVGLGVGLLGQELGGHDTRGIADPLDLDVRMVLVEAGGILLQVVRLDRRVHGQGRLRARRARAEPDQGRADDEGKRHRPHPGQSPTEHSRSPPGCACVGVDKGFERPHSSRRRGRLPRPPRDVSVSSRPGAGRARPGPTARRRAVLEAPRRAAPPQLRSTM